MRFKLAFASILGMLASTRVDAQSNVLSCDRSATCDAYEAPHSDIEFGRKNVVLDSVGWVVGIPRKIMLWDRRVDNHDVSRQTAQTVSDYLSDRGLSDVKLRVNQYDPIGEWKRLASNKRVSPGWRYTVGVLKTAEYTLLPGRLVGHDEYNPYTNTVSIYSNTPLMGMVPSAYAYDIHKRPLPGTYATIQSLPLIAMYHESLATNEVMDYTMSKENYSPTEVRRLLYSRYGSEMGGEIGRFIPGSGTAFEIAGAIGGHSAAGYQSSIRR